jgi:hypothetical protein
MRWRRPLLAVLVLPLFALAAGAIALDAILDGDPVEWWSGHVAPIVPSAPWVIAGYDEVYGTGDDIIFPWVRGDVDLVVRTGHHGQSSVIPPVSDGTTLASAEPFGQGVPIPFSIYGSDGSPLVPAGYPAAPSYFDGLPFLTLAFADLDGDGYVGITHLDGDPYDTALERAELQPIGRRYALGRHGVAEGELSVAVGGPPQAPLRVALAAAALAGPFEDPDLHCAGCHAWEGSEAWLANPMEMDLRAVDPFPDGPPIMTKLPFMPQVDLGLVFPPFDRMAAHPDARVGAEVRVGLEPDPRRWGVGESFTIRLDGSEPTLDRAWVVSGDATHFGVARTASAMHFAPDADGSLRPGVDAQGAPVLLETRIRVTLQAGVDTNLRVLALDAQGNVAEPGALAGPLTLETGGAVRIQSPDTDGHPYRETLDVTGAAGAEIVLQADPGAGADRLVLDGPASLSAVDLVVVVSGDEGDDD